MTIAGKNFVAQRIAVARDHQADQHLFAIAAVIARVAALRLSIASGFPLEVRTGDVIKKQVVFQAEQLSQTLLEVKLQENLLW